MNHEAMRRSLASYVLGALGPAERCDLDEHLAACPSCREELASYAAVPGLLSRLDLAEATGATLLAPPSLLPRVLAAVETQRAGRARQLSRWRLATAGAAVAACVAAAVAGGLVRTGRPADPVAERPLVAAAGVASQGSVALRARPWGTELRLVLQGLPAAEGFQAYAVDRAGARTLVASWGPTGDGRADVPAATGLAPVELSRVLVQTRAGAQLLVLDT